jgi:hypothetical protein
LQKVVCVVTLLNTLSSTGKKADVICAAYFAGEAVTRLLRPGNNNEQVTQVINKIAEAFKG